MELIARWLRIPDVTRLMIPATAGSRLGPDLGVWDSGGVLCGRLPEVAGSLAEKGSSLAGGGGGGGWEERGRGRRREKREREKR
jgi:hypothetical protein